MALSLFDGKGTPPERQRFAWRKLVGKSLEAAVAYEPVAIELSVAAGYRAQPAG